jgi:Cu/Ag efflux protein CusF
MEARASHLGSRCGCPGLIVSLLLLAGCASYRLEPLAASHPAHPGAPTAPEPPRSHTLAYSPSDIPTVQAVAPGAKAPHGEHQANETEQSVSPAVIGEGEVVTTVPSASQIVLEHGEIQGFMEAMTMGYRVDPSSLLAGLRPGDKVRFTIDVEKRTITAIERLK